MFEPASTRPPPVTLNGTPSPMPGSPQLPQLPQLAQLPPLWTVRLLGAVELSNAAVRIDRFATRAVAALLARLALAPERVHPREELIELLWPGVALAVGRNRLRQALSTLKNLLEPPGAAAGAVLLADRMGVRVVPGALACDALQFDDCARRGDPVGAHALYCGELMPGHYDEWVQAERARMLTLYERLPELPAPTGATGATGAAVANAAGSGPSQGLPPPSPPRLPSGLPSFWTRSIGAELTASRLQVLVCAQRLVTVHGPGGSGKTRLAVDVASALRDTHETQGGADGLPRAMSDLGLPSSFERVVFVPLVDCVSATQALGKICSALHSRAEGDLLDHIISALSHSQALLVLDNTEQLDTETGTHITSLLRALPALHVLVTSRGLLDIDGEHAFELGGLALPAPDCSLAEAATNPAVLLFIDRARAAQADYHLSPRNLHAVVGLMRLLGGMPLAIELAASRVRALSAAELLHRLSDSAGTPMLDLLTRSAQRTTPGSRHASMRHVVDWSWCQLLPEQRELLQAMSVFGAPADIDAIAAVAGVARRQAEARLDELLLASLVHSVSSVDRDTSASANTDVGPVAAAGGPVASTRFVLLQPVREFAAECWDADAARQARSRLRQWLTVLAAHNLPRQPAKVAAELAHVHAAITTAIADGAGAEALALGIAMRDYWDTDDLPLASLQALEQALPQSQSHEQTVDAHELLSLGFGNAGLAAQSVAHAQAALSTLDAWTASVGATDERRFALALARWIFAVYVSGAFDVAEIMRALDKATALAEHSTDLLARATVLRAQAMIVSNLHLDFVRSEDLAAQGQHLWEALGHSANARTLQMNRATMRAWQGRNEEALPVLQRCEVAASADGDWVGALHAARQAGRVQVRLRQWPQAVTSLRRAVHVGWQRRYARGLANALINLPQALLLAGQPEAAARLQGFAMAHWLRLYGQPNRIELAEAKRARRLLRCALGPARADRLRLDGEALVLSAAVALALDAGAA